MSIERGTNLYQRSVAWPCPRSLLSLREEVKKGEREKRNLLCAITSNEQEAPKKREIIASCEWAPTTLHNEAVGPLPHSCHDGLPIIIFLTTINRSSNHQRRRRWDILHIIICEPLPQLWWWWCLDGCRRGYINICYSK